MAASSSNGRGRRNGGRRTGISREILTTLSDGPLTIERILERLGPRSEGVTSGTIWTTLERAMHNGLVRSSRSDEGSLRPFSYSLTDGGVRRVKWIQGARQFARRPRAVANPGKAEEED